MKQRPAKRAGWFWICLIWSGVLACDGSQSAAPDNSDEVRSIAKLPNVQLLFEGTAPLSAAMYRTDSVFSGLVIGRLTLDGKPGDEVGLQLDIPDYVLAAAGPDARVRVVAPGGSESFSLPQLTQGMIVYRIARVGQTRMTVELERRVKGVREGAVKLSLRTNATIHSAELPWQKATGPEPRKPASLNVDPPCTLQIGSGSCGEMTYTVVPSAGTTLPPGYTQIGGTFQSQAGNGPSTTIRLTFSHPIESITATIHDPTWAGNRMVAFDLNTGQQVSVDFVGNGTPGTNTPDIKTLTGRFSSVDLIPAANDYVSYDVEVVQAGPPPCPPTGDSALDQQSVREALNSEWDLSNEEGLERGGWVYRDSTSGQFFVMPDPGSARNACSYTVRGPQLFPGWEPYAYYHTHIIHGGMIMPCPGRPANARALAGPSPQDMRERTKVFPATGKQYHSYVIDGLSMYKVLPTSNTPAQWPWHTANGCR